MTNKNRSFPRGTICLGWEGKKYRDEVKALKAHRRLLLKGVFVDIYYYH
jgi:hypothetical protein